MSNPRSLRVFERTRGKCEEIKIPPYAEKAEYHVDGYRLLVQHDYFANALISGDIKKVIFEKSDRTKSMKVSNSIGSLLLSDLPSLEELIIEDSSSPPQFRKLVLKGCFKNLGKISISDTKLRTFSISNCPLKQIKIHYSEIQSVNIQIPNLEILDLIHNPLKNLVPKGLFYLQILNVVHCQLETLDCQELFSLKELYCDSNQLRELCLENLVHLRIVSAFSNKIDKIVFTNLPSLAKIDLRMNKLLHFVIAEGFSEFDNLFLGNNPIEMIQIFGCQKIGTIGVPGTLRCFFAPRLFGIGSIQGKIAKEVMISPNILPLLQTVPGIPRLVQKPEEPLWITFD